MTDSISPTDVAEEHEEVATPNEMEAPSLADFGMYRCESCNKIVLGFDRPNHNRDFHAGKEPPYKKIR